MDTISMKSENNKTSGPHVLIPKPTDKLDLRKGKKNVELLNLSIYSTGKSIKSSYIIASNLKYQLQHGMRNFDFQMGHIL